MTNLGTLSQFWGS